MSSDGGPGGLVGGLFGGKGGFSKVLQDLLGGPQNVDPTASGAGASGKVNIPTPDNPGGLMQAPRSGSMQGQPGMPGTSSSSRPSPSNMPGAVPPSRKGAAAGAGASAGGLGSLLDRLRNAGLGDQVSSWLSDGPNKTLQPDQVTQAIGMQQISDMAAHAGVSPDEITTGLAKALPEVVDKMTPHGQIPPADQTYQTMNRLFG